MRQLALELNGYPRPIAWTLSEVDRAVGDRDRHNMLLTALEEITRYLVIIQLARYTELWAQGRRSAEVEQQLADLRRPSFGHYVSALGTLDRYLAESKDPYAIGASTSRRSNPAMLRFFVEMGRPAKKVSILGFLAKLVEVRNHAKGHGYTDQQGARAITAHLQPALIELLNHMPLLIARPLVWIERIEYIDTQRWVVTLLELMGTQRARRMAREVRDPGNLKKGFAYMWDGESSPLQLTPFLHLDQTSHDELVYVLAGFAGEPTYQARGSATARRRPDQLMSQLEERAPFLMHGTPAVTTPRAPDAARFYRHAVEVALADGEVSAAEAARLEAVRLDLGLLVAEAAAIHAELGWSTVAHDPRPIKLERGRRSQVPEPAQAPASESIPDDFELPSLSGTPRLDGSVWKPRILWALEWARRHDPGPKSAADIATILSNHGVRVPGTNTARAFRTERDDPRKRGLVEQGDGQRYSITPDGRRALLELLCSLAKS
ncbi:MAG: hypothetical protein AB1Z98_27635 [Nannocystaceae bacterium]